MQTGTLYVISTPIGNLKDITLRALEVLQQVDLIAAEDTRHTGILLKHHQISKRMLSYHEHNEVRRAKELVEFMLSGGNVSLVSNAGTPAVSDPGYRVIRQAHEQGIPVVPIPGASAVLAALAMSGLPTDRFLFEGFLPKKKGRTARLKSLAAFDGTVVIYEAPQRVAKTLGDIRTHFGNRSAALCREITKRYESVIRGSIQELMDGVDQTPPKGECVLVIGKEGLA